MTAENDTKPRAYCAACECEIVRPEGEHKRWSLTVRLTQVHMPLRIRAVRAVCTVEVCETCAGVRRGDVLQLISKAGRKGMN